MLDRKYAIILIGTIVALAIGTYIQRAPTGDDAWFAEQSYWFLEDGLIRSEFFTGLNDWHKELLVSHKFFLWFGAALMYLFGYDLPVVQFTGLIPFVSLVFMLIYYLRYRGEKGWTDLVLAMLFLIFANRLMIKISFQNRPEMLLAALGFGAFLLLFTGRDRPWKTLLAGILSGLAFVGHMNGIIYLFAGFATLFILKQYKKLALFTVAGIGACSLYLIDVLGHPEGVEMWIYQFSNDPAAGNGMNLKKKLIQMVTYPRLFLHSPEQMALSALLIYVAFHQRNRISQLPVALKIYSTALFVSFWLITKGNSAMYMVLFIPFMLVLVYELYRIQPFISKGLKISLLAYLIIGTVGMGQLIHHNMKFGNLPENYKSLRPILPEDGTGLVPLTFFFNEYEEFDLLLSHENYKLHYHKQNLSPQMMAVWGKKMDVDFILFDYEFLKESFYPRPGQKILPYYKLTHFDGRFAIYEQIQ